ncbi:hypothetical protein HPB51_019620 [Rhipicephalus microplus]|uniref:BTB domain-containing protein n=1 Tax=Rhipicephalus microplus TaxID=6941 RepID=A0A9J6F8D6_RHIMP|nr:hypothetical protein HPB51_019620 [Rhipicephalus microplus]
MTRLLDHPVAMWEIFANELSLSLEGVSLSRDCVIRTDDGGEFRAHRGFLCSSSPVFQALFSVNNGGRRDIRLHDVSSPTMAALLAYCYSSKVSLPIKTQTTRVVACNVNRLAQYVREKVCCVVLI